MGQNSNHPLSLQNWIMSEGMLDILYNFVCNHLVNWNYYKSFNRFVQYLYFIQSKVFMSWMYCLFSVQTVLRQ